MVGFQTQIYILSGALGGAILLMIIWVIIISINIRKLKKLIESNSLQRVGQETVSQSNLGIPRTFMQYQGSSPDPTSIARQPEENSPQDSVQRYDPSSRLRLGPQVLPHPESRGGRSRQEMRDGRSGQEMRDGRSGYEMRDERSGYEERGDRAPKRHGRQNFAFVDDGRQSNKGQPDNSYGGYGY